MRHVVPILLSLILLITTSCIPLTNQAAEPSATLTQVPTTAPIVATPDTPLTQAQLIQHIQESTVALVIAVGDRHVYMPYCAGVWVGPRLILTAAHCLEESDKPIVNLVGTPVHYVSRQDVRGIGEE